MNVYMLSFTSNSGVITRQDILDFLDTKKEVLNWFAAMPFTVILVSKQSHNTLSEMLRIRFGNNITFLLTQIVPHTIDGYINKQVWDFINDPKSSGRWE
jgi:hypothetical protein